MKKNILLALLALSAACHAQTRIYASETFSGTANNRSLQIEFPMRSTPELQHIKAHWHNAPAPCQYNFIQHPSNQIELVSTQLDQASSLPKDRMELQFNADFSALQGIWTDDDQTTNPANLQLNANPHYKLFADFITQHLREHNGKINSIELAPTFHFDTDNYNIHYIDGLILSKNIGITHFSPHSFRYSFSDESDQLIKYGSTSIYQLISEKPTILLVREYNRQTDEFTDNFGGNAFYEIWQYDNKLWHNNTQKLVPAKTNTHYDDAETQNRFSYYFDPNSQTLTITKTNITNDDDFWSEPIQSDDSDPNKTTLHWQNSKFIKITNPTPKN